MMLERLLSHLPNLPSLTTEAEIPVYMIHTGCDAEDYFFLFNFEIFAENSKKGAFVRPRLKVWAGRDDFSRSEFAKHFRQSFQTEFDRMREALGAGKESRGWLTWDLGAAIVGAATGFVANIVLWIALSGMRELFGRIELPGWMKGKSAEAKLEDDIAGLTSKVDAALREINIALHPELYDRARDLGGPVQRSRVAPDAWPLPEYVRTHFNEGESGSWW